MAALGEAWELLLKCEKITRSIRDSETSIDFVQGSPGSHRERVKKTMPVVQSNPNSPVVQAS